MRSAPHRGFTLSELLIVISIISVMAVVAMPMLSGQNAKKIEVAVGEVGNALRFAIEGGRSGAYLLVDGKTVPGRLKIVASDASGANLGPVIDPLTKRAYDIDIEGGPFSSSVTMTPAFMQGGTAYKQLLVGPAGQLRVFDGPSDNRGALQSGSGILLSLGSDTIVTIHETTGFVAFPSPSTDDEKKAKK